MILEKFGLSGKVAMVTGAGRGLGLQMALALADVGAKVAIAELDPQNGEDSAEQIRTLGVEAICVETNVVDPDSVQNAVDTTVKAFGRIDVLVNNAGISIWHPAEEMPREDWLKVLDVNLNGVFLCAQAVGRVMLQQGSGSIINIASMSGTIVNIPQQQVGYNTSKAAVVHLTKCLAVEWAKRGIRVNSISPGPMETAMTQEFLDQPKYGGVWREQTPMGRLGQPDELGPLVVFLASDASSFMTGSNVIIDGGYTCV